MKRLCPICQSASKTLLQTISFEQFDSAILPSEYNIVSCNQCGFVYDDLQASKDDFDQYYQQQNKYETKGITGSGAISDLDKKRYEQYINFLSPYLSADSRIIDIGCGQGGFLHTLKEHGYHNLLAVDPSPHCVSMIQSQGIEAICSTLDDLNINDTFDLVCMTAVLEHIYDLRTAAGVISKLAGFQGFIFADVPDALRYVDYFLAPLYRYDQEHINHFSLTHLGFLFEMANAPLTDSAAIELQVSRHNVIPTIMGLFKKSSIANQANDPDFHINNDFKLKEKIEEEIAMGEQLVDYNALFLPLVYSKERIAVWGLGAHALRLLKETTLSACNIVTFIDNNPHKCGKTLRGIPVISSDEMYSRLTEYNSIIISSVLYGKEMSNALITHGYKGNIYTIQLASK